MHQSGIKYAEEHEWYNTRYDINQLPGYVIFRIPY
jgi:hypothetical protein